MTAEQQLVALSAQLLAAEMRLQADVGPILTQLEVADGLSKCVCLGVTCAPGGTTLTWSFDGRDLTLFFNVETRYWHAGYSKHSAYDRSHQRAMRLLVAKIKHLHATER